MRVCAVTTWPPHRDGVALYSAQLYPHIAKFADARVIANIPEEPYKSTEEEGVDLLRCWKRGSFTYPLRVFHSALKARPQIVHLQYGWLLYGNFISSIYFIILLCLFRLSRKPCVVTLHTVIRRGTCIHNNSTVDLLIRIGVLPFLKLVGKLSAKIIVHNPQMKETLQREYALREKCKIAVIPHGVKRAEEGPKMPKDGNNKRILSLGFIRKGKGLEYLIEAFEKFLNQCPDAQLVIVGGRHAHDREGYLEGFRRSVKPDAQKHVLFTGFIDEKTLDGLIWTSDIIVLPYMERRYIEISGALARVADYGRPVICNRVPKFQCELQNREECIMTDPSEPAELTQALISLTKNIRLRKRLGESLRKKFETRYWSTVAEQHVKLYESILKG